LARGKGGVEVELRFTDWRMDPPVPDAKFRFEAPPGVTIVDGELLGGNGAVNQ
jgi:outer membrane lipoprotein-sorting protein